MVKTTEWRDLFLSGRFALGALVQLVALVGNVVTSAAIFTWASYAPPWVFPLLMILGCATCIVAVSERLGKELAEARSKLSDLAALNEEELALHSIELDAGPVSAFPLARRQQNAEVRFRALEAKVARGELVPARAFQELTAQYLELTATCFGTAGQGYGDAAEAVRAASAKLRDLLRAARK